jgi:hypothetical protein
MFSVTSTAEARGVGRNGGKNVVEQVRIVSMLGSILWFGFMLRLSFFGKRQPIVLVDVRAQGISTKMRQISLGCLLLKNG